MTGFRGAFVAEGRSRLEIERIVCDYLREHQPQHIERSGPLDVVHLMDPGLWKAREVSIAIVDSKSRELESGELAQLVPDDNEIRITQKHWDELDDGESRARFTGCHETYHCIDHLPQLRNMDDAFFQRQMVLSRRVPPVYQDPEWHANHGAAVLLMPACTVVPFYRRLRRSKDESYIVEAIMDEYQVSLEAVEWRLTGLRKDNAI